MKLIFIIFCILIRFQPLSAQNWENITARLLHQIGDTTFQNDPFNRRVGNIVVQPKTGDLFLVLNGGHPVYRSKTRGRNWKALKGTAVQGRSYGGFATSLDYNTNRMAFFMIVQKSQLPARGVLLSSKGKFLGEIDKPPHDGWTWGMPAWEQKDIRVLLAKEHHAWVVMWKSVDGGTTWEKLRFESRNPGVISEQIFVAGNDDGIYRSTDQGESWVKVSDYIVNGKTPIRYGSNYYWTVPDGVLVSKDAGKTWEVFGEPISDALWGPYFGRSQKELMVVTPDGFFISYDGALTWKKAAGFFKIPKAQFEGKYNIMHPTNSYGWDAKRKIIYAAGLGGDAYKIKF